MEKTQFPFHICDIFSIQEYIIYINSVSLCVCDGGFGGWGKGEVGEATGHLSTTGNRFHFLITAFLSGHNLFACPERERARS